MLDGHSATLRQHVVPCSHVDLRRTSEDRVGRRGKCLAGQVERDASQETHPDSPVCSGHRTAELVGVLIGARLIKWVD